MVSNHQHSPEISKMSKAEASKETTTTKSKINESVLTYAEVLRKSMTVDKKEATVSGHEGVYEATLPEGLTMETVESLDTHNDTFVAAGTLVAGELFVEAMASNKKLDSGSVVYPMGKNNTLSVDVKRLEKFKNHLSGNGEEVTKYGVVTASYDVRGANRKVGQLKAVRAEIAELAQAALAKK
jgi:hypothetical protein